MGQSINRSASGFPGGSRVGTAAELRGRVHGVAVGLDDLILQMEKLLQQFAADAGVEGMGIYVAVHDDCPGGVFGDFPGARFVAKDFLRLVIGEVHFAVGVLRKIATVGCPTQSGDFVVG